MSAFFSVMGEGGGVGGGGGDAGTPLQLSVRLITLVLMYVSHSPKSHHRLDMHCSPRVMNSPDGWQHLSALMATSLLLGLQHPAGIAIGDAFAGRAGTFTGGGGGLNSGVNVHLLEEDVAADREHRPSSHHLPVWSGT